MDVIQVCEILMLVLFGCSWPMNIVKSVRSRTAKGKSLLFEVLVLIGYAAGMYGKIYALRTTGVLPYSFWFYVADALMVAIDLSLTVRNRRLDRQST